MIKHCIKNVFILTLIMMVSACDSNSYSGKFILNYIPLEDEENEKYVLLGADAQIMSSTFKESPTLVVNGFFAMEEEDGMTLCRMNGSGYEKIEGAAGLSEVGIMNDGLIPVCKDYEHIQILDENGNHVFTLDSINGAEVEGCYCYASERLRVKLTDGSYAYVDKNGTQLFGKTYDWCSDFDRGVAVVNVEDDSYALINTDGHEIFTFDSRDKDKIKFSSLNEKLATADKDGRIIIYDFQGKQVGIYPSKVTEVIVFCKESFIFANDDDDCGLMAYTGEEMIRAKYECLVPNGKYFLAMHEDRDEEIRLIDEHENILKTLDGEDIYPFRCVGYDFPNAIIRPDEEIYLVNDYGDIIGKGSVNYKFDEDEILEDPTYVNNLFFPQDDVLSVIMNWCGNGTGLPNGQNAFFYRDGNHCYPYNVNFIKNNANASKLKGKYSAFTTISQGVNHDVEFGVYFDEPIVRDSELSRTAWLTKMDIKVVNGNSFLNAAFFNVCRNRLIELGCTPRYSNNNDHILTSNNGNNLIVMTHDIKNYSFHIQLIMNNENNVLQSRRLIESINNK